MDQVSYEAFKEKLDNAVLQNIQLKSANNNLKRINKDLRRVIKKLKDEASQERKPHYKNGRRGSKFNG
jgi:hypothetical protein